MWELALNCSKTFHSDTKTAGLHMLQLPGTLEQFLFFVLYIVCCFSDVLGIVLAVNVSVQKQMKIYIYNINIT